MSWISTAQRYLASKDCTTYFREWMVVVVLALEVVLVGEQTRPFLRDFSLTDLTIQHQFAMVERVGPVECILISIFVPAITMLITILLKEGAKNLENKQKIVRCLHVLHMSVLGLLISITLNGVITDTLKNWIGRPRPDFIQRCGPIQKNKTGLVDISICTSPMGESILLEGLRSCPSGHTSTAFSGLFYLTLWLIGQMKALKPGQPTWKLLVALAPTLLAAYIGISRTQDYKHHFTDILFGGTLGGTMASLLYLKFFPSVYSENSAVPHHSLEEESLLP